MEPRVGEVICSVDSMIRLLDDVNSDYFKANFDTGHFSAQREAKDDQQLERDLIKSRDFAAAIAEKTGVSLRW